MNILLFTYILVTLFIILWISFPLIKPGRTGQGGAMDELALERTNSLLHSLKALYASQVDREDDDDFVNIENRLMLELAKIYRDQGLDPNTAEGKQSAKRCFKCGANRKREYKFCAQCGSNFTST